MAGTPQLRNGGPWKVHTWSMSVRWDVIRKERPENQLRHNQAAVCDRVQLLLAKEDIQGAEDQRSQS